MKKDEISQTSVKSRMALFHSKRRSFIKLYLVIIIGIVFTTIIGYTAFYFYHLNDSINKSYSSTGLSSEKKAEKLIQNKKPISFLVLGTDIGTDGGFGTNRNRVGLTDSMMIVTVNPKKETTTLISIPRDIMTSISGFENSFPQKLNAAYAFKEASDDNASLGDGVGTTMDTIQKMFNFPINYFAMVNMSGLGDVVDQIGGVSVKSPLTFAFSQETAHETGKDLYQFTQGSSSFKYAADGKNYITQHKMDGKAALAFSRMRYQDPKGDYGRTERQRILLQQIIRRIKQNPTKVVNLNFINATTKNIASNLKSDDMLTLGTNYINATKNIVSYTVQGQGELYDGVSYQRVTKAQRQAITNKVRTSLDMDSATTGGEFGSEVTAGELAQVGTADELYPENNTSENLKLTEE
ncbi:LytR family transcriptional regulator [Leuconostoc litchii]|uniref:Transcriptional regulator n=1 Tax=Leuconostoc litchii TaxID=1981069 RepID=A0A6P2CNV6_9LACO|nr:LCP family protein [Leuconostoc litchii]TYC47063.1 transcriptional regulator [Leuconostoc litchii]GMA68997.1 LytR family transcriptional regulator [Leuconostoc litchii]